MKMTWKTTGRLAALAVAAMMATLTVGAAPAMAKPTMTPITPTPKQPMLTFDKNQDSPLKSTLTITFRSNGKNYKATVRAGSGDGTKNDCTKNKGWLPNGKYENVKHYKKTWGNEVVRGWVWELGSKKCSSGSTTRTELFVHSNGIEGTPWNGSYASNGCVKIEQSNRKWFSTWWRGTPNASKGFLTVKS